MNQFFALPTEGEEEESLDVVTGTLQLISIVVHALLYHSATLLFLTPLVAKKSDVLLDILIELIWLTTKWVTLLFLEEYLGVFQYLCQIELHQWI